MKSGLEDVVAAETILSDVDGLAGRLIIRGISLDDLAGTPYEQVLALLWGGFFDLPQDLTGALARARSEVFAHVASADPSLEPVDAIRALMALIPDGNDLETALRLVAAPAVFTPAVLRLQAGQQPVAPRPGLGHAADILNMLTGKAPSA